MLNGVIRERETRPAKGLHGHKRGRVGGYRNLAHPEGNVGDEFAAGPFIQLGDQGRLQVRKLLKPDRIPYEEVQFLETDVQGPRMGGDRFAGKLSPLLLEPQLEEVRLESEPLGHAGENHAE
jgi:hypothetical protein